MNRELKPTPLIISAVIIQIVCLLLVIYWSKLGDGSRPYTDSPEYISLFLMLVSIFSLGLLYASMKAGADKIYLVSAVILSILCLLGSISLTWFILAIKEWSNNF